jgi:hypothetical protein
MNKLSLTAAAFFLFTTAFAAHSIAKPQDQAAPGNSPSHEAQFTAISVVRTINTAEVGYRFSKANGSAQSRHRYATWSELYASGILDKMRRSTPDVSSLIGADGVQGYNLALIVSPDGQSYQLALHDAKPENALFSVFSDQSGLIYTGSPLQ